MHNKRSFWKALLVMAVAALLTTCLATAASAAGVSTNVWGLVLDDPKEYSSQDAYVDDCVEKILAFLDLDGSPDWAQKNIQ